MVPDIKFTEKLSLFWRSFFIQAFWNFHNMQAIGLLFMLNGIRRKLGLSDSEKENFRSRHLTFYNGHPYFSGLPAAVLASVENAHKLSEKEINALIKFREIVSSPLGAIGDLIFWSNLRPLVLLAPIYFLLTNMNRYALIFALLTSVLLYNIIQLSVRWWSIGEGLRYGYGVFKDFNMRHFEKEIHRLKALYIFTTFALIGAALFNGLKNGFYFGLTLAINMIIIFWLKTRIKNPVYYIFWGLLLLWGSGRFLSG
jgi:mannose/fructose/N-acetylgalactosamine-specific phosphotransferase system component IID